MKVYWLKGNSGWCVTKLKGKYVAAFGDEEQVVIFPPYTTRYQAKKLARKWASKKVDGEEMNDWSKYPIGTKAFAINGGYWEKVKRGWKWCNGSTFPTPGADVSRVEEPQK